MLNVEVIIREGDRVIDHSLHSTDNYCGAYKFIPTKLENGDLYYGYTVTLTMDYSLMGKDKKDK